MSLYVVEDSEAKDEFGYRKVEQYRIYVKRSVYHKMLKEEMKKPSNWLHFGQSVFSLLGNVFMYAVIFSSCITFLYFLWLLSNGQPMQDVATSMLGVSKMLFVLYFIMFFVAQTILFLLNRKGGLAKNNAFSEVIFYRLSNRASQIEAQKNEKTN